jgi:hypothetical protein
MSAGIDQPAAVRPHGKAVNLPVHPLKRLNLAPDEGVRGLGIGVDEIGKFHGAPQAVQRKLRMDWGAGLWRILPKDRARPHAPCMALPQ